MTEPFVVKDFSWDRDVFFHVNISFSLINGIIATWGTTAFPNHFRRETRFFWPVVTLGMSLGSSSQSGIPSTIQPNRSSDYLIPTVP